MSIKAVQPGIVPDMKTPAPNVAAQKHGDRTENFRIEQLLEEQISLQKRQFDISKRKINGLLEEYRWIDDRPPVTWYPIEWYHSLEDTPEQYKVSKTQEIGLRKGITAYFMKRNPPEGFKARTWTSDDAGPDAIFNRLSPDELLYISMYNVSSKMEVVNTSTRAYNRFPEYFEYTRDDEVSFIKFYETTEEDDYGRNDDRHGPSLWSRYLDGNPQDHPAFEKKCDKDEKIRLNDKGYRLELSLSHKKKLLDILKDSVRPPIYLN